MNERELQKHINQLKKISAYYCLQEGGSHGPDHSDRVFTTSLSFGKELGANLLVLGTAALLHDIGRKDERTSKGAICHARRGAELTRKHLQELNYASDAIDAICHCIRSHRFRKGESPATLEARILFDADKLDSIGAIGIGRAFLFAGQIGACLHNPELDHNQTSSYSAQDSAYREFQVKMSRVKDQMLTLPGKRLAKKRHTFMEIFFDQLNHEIYGV
jgi:uncharacterized protein